MSYQLEVHIEHFVLSGLPRVDQARLGEVVSAELTRLFNRHPEQTPPFEQDQYRARLPVSRITVTDGGTVEGLGKQIAEAIYGGLKS